MSKKDKEELITDIVSTYSKAENFFEENKKSVSFIILIAVALIGGYYAYQYLYMEPLEQEAKSQMFMAEKYFEKDSLDKALYGDGNYFGFIDLIDEYSGTKAANLSHYYAGICLLKKGEYEKAIDHLKSFKSDDILVSSIALGSIADAYVELGDYDKAISYYDKAANNKANILTSPIYLMKAGKVSEAQKDYESAVKFYSKIKEKYKDTYQGRNIEKYLARAKAYIN